MFLFVLSASAQTYEQWVERGIKAAEADSLTEAINYFKKALKVNPKDYRNALVFTNMGKVQETMYWQNTQEKQNASDAIESYTMALSFAPEAVPMLEARGKLYLRLENYGKALMDFTTILDVDPHHKEARNYRAFCYSQRHEYLEARTDYLRVLEEDATNYSAQLGLALLCQNTNKMTEALERITLMVEGHPDKAELYSVRAGMYAENKQSELAIMDLDKAVELEPENQNYYLARAYLHKEQGNKRKALADFEAAIKNGVPRASLEEELKSLK
ncbi:MAG: tetratricopeptide repeat protein [Bacteroidaceae bacterium]|nr:tetratricopeptide repeat protein [Bacteroidaceae bacterium]